MTDFKLGDRVRVNDHNRGVELYWDMVGTVVSLGPAYIRVDLDNYEEHAGLDSRRLFLPDELEHLVVFKVGDRVRVLESKAHGWSNREGEIIEKASDPYDWRVEFKRGNGSIPGTLDAAFHAHELEKVGPVEGERFKPGDRVDCNACYDFEPCVGTVTGFHSYDKESFTGQTGYYTVKVEGQDSGDRENDGAWAYYEGELKLAEPERTFQEGDRVVIVKDLEGDFPHYVGKTGTVSFIDDEEPDGYIYSVEFDDSLLGVFAHPDELELHAPTEEPMLKTARVFVAPVGTLPGEDGWVEVGAIVDDVLAEKDEPAAAPDPDAPDWERQANRRLALELAVKSAEGLRAGRGNIVGRARAFERFLNGEGE